MTALLAFLEWSGYFWALACLIGAATAWWYLPAPVSRPIVAVLLCVAAASYLLRHAYSNGQQNERTKWEAALQKEKDRRATELAIVQKRYMGKVIELSEMEVENARLNKELKDRPPPADDRFCLDVDGVRRLREF